MSKIHKIKILFKSIKWYFNLLSYARTHAREVNNYVFLVETRKIAHAKYLEMERKEIENDKLIKLQAQIDIIDKVLNYVRK